MGRGAKRERSRNVSDGKDGLMIGLQHDEWRQDFLTSVNQPKISKRKEESVHEALQKLQIRQMKLLEALTPFSYVHSHNSKLIDMPLLQMKNESSDLQTEPPSIFEVMETNMRYKDVSGLLSLFEKHESDSERKYAEDHTSDGGTLSSILKYTHIIGNK